MIDTHSHINSKDLSNVQSEIDFINKLGYLDYIINVGLDIDTSIESCEISANDQKFYSSIGVHPLYEGNVNKLIEIYNNNERKIVAIGETGLDSKEMISSQITKLIYQIELANFLELPIIIHSNNTNKEVIEILKKHFPKYGFVFHCFQPDTEIANKIIEMGGYISFGTPITKSNAKRSLEVIKMLPIDRILIELDYPYMSNNPVLDGKNVFNRVREIKNISYSDLECQLDSNARRLFKKLI